MSTPNQDQIRFILESAILAPSADNRHPVRFEVCEDLINIWFDKGALPPPGGYKRVLALLSLGAMSENFTIAASRYGQRVEPRLFPEPAHPDLALQLVWQPDRIEPEPLWESIPLRHTNRQVSFCGPISSEDLSKLENAAMAIKGCGLSWLDEPKLKRQALHLIRLAESERFHNPALHAELFSAIRFDVRWNASCEEGLPPGSLAIEPLLHMAFSLLRHWPLMKILNLFGASFLLGLRAAYLPCRLAPHLGAISALDTSDTSCLNAGRTFQRIWLTATRAGLALQPMPASAIYAIKEAKGGNIPVSLQQHLNQGWLTIMPQKTPLMLFRVGLAAPPAIRAGRKPFKTFLIDS